MDRAVDIFHPLTSLSLRECSEPPEGISYYAQAVCLIDKVYLGGGYNYLSTSRRALARLYIYTPASNTWVEVNTPVYGFALTTYKSKLVLVGGNEYVGENVDGRPSNKLWTLSEHGQWEETLPPMDTACSYASAVSHGDHLLVIDGDRKEVRVYNGYCWAKAQHLPERLHMMKSTIVNGDLYVLGGPINEKKNKVYYASLESLIASCRSCNTSQPSIVWKRLPDVPIRDNYPAVYGDQLIAVGLEAIYAYFPSNHCWVNVGSSPTLLPVPSAVIVLPSNELMVFGVTNVFKVTLNMTPFDPDSNFTMKALSLVVAAGIPLMSSLYNYPEHIEKTVGVSCILPYMMTDTPESQFGSWLQRGGKVPPTWRNLLQIIRQLHLDDLANEVENYLGTGRVKYYPKEGEHKTVMKEEGVDDRGVLFQDLSQSNMATLTDMIKELRSENEQLRSQLSQAPIKEEVKEKPLSIVLVKTEVKEEAVTVTKDEPTSAQPTAAWDLRGVEVCGETTVVVHSSSALHFTWEGYGLKLHIHEGSLPPGIDQCTLSIKASLAGQYEFPENSYLVSAVFWLRCEPMCKFTKPVTVEMQHCARSENVANLNLKFVRAVCSQKQLPYTFKQLGGDFTSHSSYGVIEVNGFSGLAITQEGSEEREYCSKLFYLSNYFSGHRIDFVITWNTETHLNVVKRHYIKERAHAGPDQPVDFIEGEIRLDLPMAETKVNDTWTIVPLIDPVVRKKEVDSYLPGKRIPHCQLEAHPIGDSVARLVHKIDLLGAKPPRNMFMLSYTPPRAVQEDPDLSSYKRSRIIRNFSLPLVAASTKQHSAVTGPQSRHGVSPLHTSDSVATRLSSDHLSSLLQQLYGHAAKWRDIGGALGFTQGELDTTEASPSLLSSAPKSWLRSMLSAWLEWAPGDGRGSTHYATLEGLKDALRQANLGATADSLLL